MILLVVACFLVVGFSLAAFIAVRNYRGARVLIEAGPSSSLLKDPGVENLQTITFVSRGIRLAGWYIPSKNRAAVVVTHGSHSDRAGMLAEMRILAASGFGVLTFDWPGLGESGGPIRWGAEAQDALRAAIDWLVAQPDVDPHRIGGLGFSIGGFVLTQVAAKDTRLRAVIIESAATDFDEYVGIHNGKWGILSEWPARWALRNSEVFLADNSALRNVGEISPRPLFIIGQTGDTVVPASMLRKLDSAAHLPKQLWLIEGAGHGNYEQAAGPEYAHRVSAFFQENLTSP